MPVIATSRLIVNLNKNAQHVPSPATPMHTVSSTLLSPSRQSNNKLRPVLSTSSSTNHIRQRVAAILARVIPVTEVDKWQPQSKLQQPQQQIPSNAG